MDRLRRGLSRRRRPQGHGAWMDRFRRGLHHHEVWGIMDYPTDESADETSGHSWGDVGSWSRGYGYDYDYDDHYNDHDTSTSHDGISGRGR